MLSKATLKEIIASNERFIVDKTGRIVEREGMPMPGVLRKTVVLYGARRSGKTFILFDLFKKSMGGALYVDFEDERLGGFRVSDFERLKDAFLELKPHLSDKPLTFLLDEVQNIEGWERFCRRAVERENAKVFVSGSSSKIMPSELHTELRGRSWGIEVLPFSFREYLKAKGADPDDQSIAYGPRKALTKNHFSEYLRWGGFPEVAALDSEFERTKLLNEYMGAMFFKDLVERHEITNIPLLESLWDKLFSAFSLKFSVMLFYRQHRGMFALSKDMLFKYYRHFLESMLVFETRKLSESAFARLRNPAKIYLVDTGLARRIASADSGRLLENAVYLELRRRGAETFYFDENRECDFAVKTGSGGFRLIQAAFEVGDENREREIGGLVDACRRLRAREGMILTFDDEEEFDREEIRVKIVPAWRWALERPAK